MIRSVTDRLVKSYTEVPEDLVSRLRSGRVNGYPVEVRSPWDENVPATLETFLQAFREMHSKWLGLVNKSPVVAFEIRRSTPGSLRFQYIVPTKRLERKLRTQLTNQAPKIGFATGETGIPVSEGDSVGGGVLTPGRKDCYPFQTQFNEPPINAVASILHRHAMQDTRFVIQLLFKPVVGEPVRDWWWRRNAFQRISYLKKDKAGALPWHDRSATSRERSQADMIEAKAGASNYKTCIRFLVIGADSHTSSRVKELSGGFNVFENPETGQYFDTVTVSHFREKPFLNFAEAVADKRFDGAPQFRTSTRELAALVSVPSIKQKNINYSQP